MAAKKSAKKTARKTVKKSAKKAGAKKASAKKAPAKHVVHEGYVAHREFLSSDPAATKAWAKKMFGWTFSPPMTTPDGEYHMWDGGDDNSGGVRKALAPKTPGTLLYYEVANIKNAYAKALKAGAQPMLAPEALPGNMGWMAIVVAPGGVTIGFWQM